MPTAELPLGAERVRLEDYTLGQHKDITRLLADNSAVDQVDREINEIAGSFSNE